MKNRIALLLPYIGNLNATGYFPQFLQSIRQNPQIDFLIFTDDTTAYFYPENVQVIPTTFSALKEQIAAHFNFPIRLDTPYQLCNFKVAYGEIFSELLKNYDFWGFTDADLIYGDMRAFLTDEMLKKYDKLYTRGHLTLFRNTEAICSAYRTVLPGKNTDFRRNMAESEISHNDEWGDSGGINRIFKTLEIPMYDFYDFDDIAMDRTNFFPSQKRMNAPYNHQRNILYEYRKGKLFRWCIEYGDVVSEEVLYAHFQKRVLQNHVRPDANEFLVVPNAIIPHQPVNAALLQSISRDKPRWEYYRDKGIRAIKKCLRIFSNPVVRR